MIYNTSEAELLSKISLFQMKGLGGTLIESKIFKKNIEHSYHGSIGVFVNSM